MIVWPSIKALNKIDSVTIVARSSFAEYYPNSQRLFITYITIHSTGYDYPSKIKRIIKHSKIFEWYIQNLT